MAISISPGTILWVCLGPRGNNKVRPAVAISSPDIDGKFYIVPGSTKHAVDSEKEIKLPWAHNRHPLTKLRRPTIVDASWIVQISMSEICEIKGRVPGRTLVEILEKIHGGFPSQDANPN